MDKLKNIFNFLAPKAEKEDGRDVWPSRMAFVLAAMGGAVGLGNILRYPSVVFPNNGLQWFIPYLIALIFLAVPLLVLEICLGQAARGGGVVAFHHVNKRAKGVGLGTIVTGYMVSTYYVPILSWAMIYFRNSFTSPLPWTGRGEEFYLNDVIANVDPIPGNYSANGKTVTNYTQYPGTGIIGETAGWCAFVWFIVFLCMFRGVGLTGRVVYITMGLPIIIIIILLGRSVSLENAVDGVKMYMGHWDSSKLASGTIWQAAAGQIFFSTGAGFGYFTTFASYNTKFSNAVQDAVIVAVSNSLFEVIAAFAVFGIIGYLGLKPGDVELSTFTVGFLTYPSAITEMPGANFWSILFFLTLLLVGISSSFALVESLVTLIADTDWGKKVPRTVICSAIITVSFLLSLMYCSRFGLYLLDAVDTWLNNLSLLFIVWSECIATTTLYRYPDILSQVGLPSYLVYNAGYFGGTIFGLAVAHSVSPEAGAGVGFGLYVAGVVISTLVAKTPDSAAPRFWGKNIWMNRFWWLAFYSGNQLMRDLNVVIATGKNWSIPIYWGPVVRYISAPILAIIVSFSYPAFYKKRDDPLHIFAFSIAHIIMVIAIVGLVLPRFFNPILPAATRNAPEPISAPNVTLAPVTGDISVESQTEHTFVGEKEKEAGAVC
ncbi:hypothetical protein EYZ11_008211 [Aspergillus tanneri]|uniref:Uncharacterized protein n=1 Tax=Aspergillus tanneri TaxID=1220188 RepID=A0A4S3JD76_9EURO|nr:uncharacterized protein ATNIH1004_010552 [Aspergillus tanneri]KAA8643778.1 hypothetical protein ATNIH1004_010552 [Aspergillus tanneri]THC92317.1 hypothetical protein EYZ11_008211 [Aspergillus tanneri]